MQSSLERLIQVAQTGQLVAFPTDTVPALAVKPESAELIFQAKQRAQDKPLILMVADINDIWDYVTGTADELEIWQQIAQKYLPGALTLVLPASSRVPATMNPNDPTTIGVRVPNLDITQTILQQTGGLATTSANLSGQPPLMTMAAIHTQFPQVVTLTSDLDITASGTPSTVIKWNRGNWQILRQGSVKFSA